MKWLRKRNLLAGTVSTQDKMRTKRAAKKAAKKAEGEKSRKGNTTSAASASNTKGPSGKKRPAEVLDDIGVDVEMADVGQDNVDPAKDDGRRRSKRLATSSG
ncbi:hypothetical protein LTR08_001960 [Meristemomyces frigidus]|nr:hypothetical protein LTR08_001960 [Meristemomyces frigidus]